jgi:hypothetical protein
VRRLQPQAQHSTGAMRARIPSAQAHCHRVSVDALKKLVRFAALCAVLMLRVGAPAMWKQLSLSVLVIRICSGRAAGTACMHMTAAVTVACSAELKPLTAVASICLTAATSAALSCSLPAVLASSWHQPPFAPRLYHASCSYIVFSDQLPDSVRRCFLAAASACTP